MRDLIEWNSTARVLVGESQDAGCDSDKGTRVAACGDKEPWRSQAVSAL